LVTPTPGGSGLAMIRYTIWLCKQFWKRFYNKCYSNI
jgi:hypothetical protein